MSRPGGSDDAGRRERLYGIPEIADRLGQRRGTVNAWYLRGTHGMPGPDQHVANVPVWFASTIEAWMARQRSSGDGESEPALSEAFVRDLGKRAFRLLALLLEEPERRPSLILRSAAELLELAPRLERAGEEQPGGAKRLSGLLALLHALPKMLPRLDGPSGSYEPMRIGRRDGERLDAIRRALTAAASELARYLAEIEPVRHPALAESASASPAPMPEPIDRERLRALLDALPPGRWTSYGEAAAALGSPKGAVAVGTMIAHDPSIPNAHRVLRADGRIPSGWRASDGGGAEVCAQRLRAEGVEVQNMRADSDQRLTQSQLSRIADALRD